MNPLQSYLDWYKCIHAESVKKLLIFNTKTQFAFQQRNSLAESNQVKLLVFGASVPIRDAVF